jgi:hypothetical protein
MSVYVAKKPLSRNILGDSREFAQGRLARQNQVLLTIARYCFESVCFAAFSGGLRCGLPTLSPRGEEGDWHARIAD